MELLRGLNRVENFSAAIRRILIRAGGEFPMINQVTERLYVSESTLRRRLREESTNFRAICDEVRNVLACQYLSTTKLTVSEIASLLNYTETVSFRRAFLRWNAITPSEYRQRATQTAGMMASSKQNFFVPHNRSFLTIARRIRPKTTHYY